MDCKSHNTFRDSATNEQQTKRIRTSDNHLKGALRYFLISLPSRKAPSSMSWSHLESRHFDRPDFASDAHAAQYVAGERSVHKALTRLELTLCNVAQRLSVVPVHGRTPLQTVQRETDG